MFAEYPYRVDLHSHSTFSDGKNSPEVMYQRAVELGLAAYALSDHDTSNGVLHLLRQDNVRVRRHPDEYPHLPLLIPGVEYSFRQGHFLVYGIDPQTLANQLEKWQIPAGSTRYQQPWCKIEDYLRWTVDHGGTVIVAHPGIPFGVLSVGLEKLVALWERKLIHGAESQNGSLEKKFGKFGKIWPRIWSQTVLRVLTKHGIPALAFSDAHRAAHLTDWSTAVPELAQALTVEKLVDPTTPRQPSRLAKR